MASHYDPTRSCVLQVTITHLIYPVTEKVLGQLFDAYGVNDVCMSQQSTHIEAFVDFQSWHEASEARGALHGRCIYDGCCFLDIQHASLSISVIRLPNSEPVVVDWDQVDGAPFASSSTQSISTPATPFTVITSTTNCDVFPEVHKARIDPIVDCEVLVVLPASHNTSALTTTYVEDGREGDDIFPADVGCIIMAPTSCSTLYLHDNSDKNFTTQVPACVRAACPHHSPDRSLSDSGVSRPLPWPSFLRDGDGERLTCSCPTTQGIWPCLQLKPPWLYSVQVLLSKGPRCREILYVIGHLKLPASCWKLSSPELPLYGNDWFLGYKVTDLVIQKNSDPSVMLQSDSTPLAFLRCSLPCKQLVFHKNSSICRTAYTDAHQWDPGILVRIFHVPYCVPCFPRVCMFSSTTANAYASSWKGPQTAQISMVCTYSLLRVSHGLFRKAATHSCTDDHKNHSYCQYEVCHDTSFITPFLPACVVFSMVDHLWHSTCSLSIDPAPCQSWRRYWSGELLGFQTSAIMQALADARRGTCVRLWMLLWSWPSCYGTRVQLNQPTAKMRHLNNELLVEVILWIKKLDMVKLASSTPGLQMFIGMSLARMLWSVAWLFKYQGDFVHTDCRIIKASKYKMEEQLKFSGIGLQSGFPHSVWLPNNIQVASLEKGSHSWEEAQGKCTHPCKFGAVCLSSTMRVHIDGVRLTGDVVKFGCFDAVLTPQLGVRRWVAINQTWELRSAENIGAQNKRHNREDTMLVLCHKQNTIVFVVIPQLFSLVQGLQWLDLLIVLEPQGVYWIGHMPVVTCVEVWDAHT